ncbi:nucleotide-diphospho-sugar transferase [Flavobacterium sp. K5-23]|uniref:nucleotide-diphospho-sugar transferase n=1 Tax=Flavobacterium sp. K5-23 TaxID=2746225 RepID=UPI0020108AA4|nr:nucleotide-diphospho-sugar transferase [Flavobacterium sp. K5-23]UQD56147.1 nucleotide-diphospho-sugar transferase [Flavobacterium sp. K5-23]
MAADGPRSNIIEDIEKCKETRNLVLKGIDWDCEVKTLFRDENFGCGKAVQNALDWFFDEVEMGIIIEDDILPDSSFFWYAEILLDRFKNDYQIFSINGCSLAYENHKYDFGLTRYFNMWGWASWRRSNDLVNKTWNTYNGIDDFKKGSKLVKSLSLPTILPQKEWINRWQFLFDATKNGNIDTWDYQWVFTCLKNQQYCIRPNLNMINNIGFNKDSTHTIQVPHIKLSNIKVNTLKITNGILNGKMKIDSIYEIVNVAEYWNGVVINSSNFIKKVNGYFKKSLNLFKNA